MVFDLKMFSRTDSIISTKSKAYDAVVTHSHSFCELTYVVSGEGVHTVNDRSSAIAAGDVYFIPDESVHSVMPVQSEALFEMINIIFDRSLLNFDVDFMSRCHFVSFADDEQIRSLFFLAYAEYKGKEIGYSEVMRHLTCLILFRILRLQQDFPRQSDVRKSNTIKQETDLVIETVMKYIETHYSEDVRIEEISRSLGMGITTIQRIFKNQKKTTVKKTLVHYRIKKACELLMYTDSPIQQISETVGFNDLKNFYMTFKNTFDMTPTEFRKKNKAGKNSPQIG